MVVYIKILKHQKVLSEILSKFSKVLASKLAYMKPDLFICHNAQMEHEIL